MSDAKRHVGVLLGVRHGVPDDLHFGVNATVRVVCAYVLQKHLEDASRFLVDESRDPAPNQGCVKCDDSYRLTPPRRARRRMAGLVMP